MIRAIVTDIEGTTSSLSFVKDVLFPYARQHLPDFVRQHAEDPQVLTLIEEVKRLSAAHDVKTVIAQCLEWIDQDQKITPLKALQGLIWADGYRQAAFTGHVYPDAATQLKHWKQQGYNLYVYSSGSVFAQKLLFGYSDFGDLTPLFSGYFDTQIGGKQETTSYQTIAEQLNLPAHQIAFLSDIQAELDAARGAGFKTYWLVRDRSIDPAADHPQVNDFAAINL